MRYVLFTLVAFAVIAAVGCSKVDRVLKEAVSLDDDTRKSMLRKIDAQIQEVNNLDYDHDLSEEQRNQAGRVRQALYRMRDAVANQRLSVGEVEEVIRREDAVLVTLSKR